MLIEQTQTRQNFTAIVRECQRYVLEYEDLAYQIAGLLSQHGGLARNLSTKDQATYRELARRRNRAYYHVRALERSLAVKNVASN
ncbi:MAG: hypothetical protein ACYDBJ_24550 [Aggregatilineales bacterium]